MVGAGWDKADPPKIGTELLAMANFPQPPQSVLWYSSQPGFYIACAHVKHAGACSHTAHEFHQLPEQGGISWSYFSGSVKQQGCTPQSPGGT